MNVAYFFVDFVPIVDGWKTTHSLTLKDTCFFLGFFLLTMLIFLFNIL